MTTCTISQDLLLEYQYPKKGAAVCTSSHQFANWKLMSITSLGSPPMLIITVGIQSQLQLDTRGKYTEYNTCQQSV